MIPARFDYEVAESVEHASALLAADPDAKLLAGGHSLVPAMKLRIARPSKLVDIGRLDDLSYVRDAGTQLAIGALTRHRDVARNALLQEHCAIVGHAAGQIGDPQVRHRGTFGGSIAHGDPASDLPAVILALGGELVEVRVPKLSDSTGWAFLKANRRAQDWATVAVAAIVHRSDGKADGASVALVNMGATPVRAAAVEAAVAAGETVADAAAHAADGTTPPDDHAGSPAYRAHLARVLCRRALEAAVS